MSPVACSFDLWQPFQGDCRSVRAPPVPSPAAKFSPIPSLMGPHGGNIASPLFQVRHQMDLMTGTPFNAMRTQAIVG